MAEDKKPKDEKKAKLKKEKNKKDRGAWFRETKAELKKVVWPSRGTVLLCSFAVGACIWIFDFAATNVVRMILTIFGG